MEDQKAVNLFDLLSDEEEALITDRCRVVQHEPGDVIFNEGELGDELFIIRDGEVRISRVISDGADHTLAVVKSGSLFGEMAVLGAHQRSATAICLSHVELLVVRGEDFRFLVEDNPETSLKLLQILVLTLIQRLGMTNNLLRDTLSWGLEVSGAVSLGFHKLMTDSAVVTLTLTSGKTIRGRLLKVDRDQGGLQLTVYSDNETVHFVPYHAILDVSFNFGFLKEGASSASDKRG